ncbi:hypothetical protein JTB14_016387 [Gonioctena quinquepunctata]|nr:hypothetical protein JTB14_016387 [Gonioctena quinquepunctata]
MWEECTIWTTLNLFNEGREHEAEDIAAVEQASGVNVIRTLLWLHSCGFLGASPDGIIGGNASVEVKCLFLYRAMSMMEEIKLSTEYIISADVDGNIVRIEIMKISSKYEGSLLLMREKIVN